MRYWRKHTAFRLRGFDVIIVKIQKHSWSWRQEKINIVICHVHLEQRTTLGLWNNDGVESPFFNNNKKITWGFCFPENSTFSSKNVLLQMLIRQLLAKIWISKQNFPFCFCQAAVLLQNLSELCLSLLKKRERKLANNKSFLLALLSLW